jgi:hypothetical protein
MFKGHESDRLSLGREPVLNAWLATTMTAGDPALTPSHGQDVCHTSASKLQGLQPLLSFQTRIPTTFISAEPVMSSA